MNILLSAFVSKAVPTPYQTVTIPVIGIKPSIQFVGSKQMYVGGYQAQSKRFRFVYEVQSLPYGTNELEGNTTQSIYGAFVAILSAPFLKLGSEDEAFPRWSDNDNFPSTSIVNGVWVVVESLSVESLWEQGKEQLSVTFQSQEVHE